MQNDKLVFIGDDGEEVESYILEQTKVNGTDYILVAESEEEDAECFILKDVSMPEDTDSIYEEIEDEEELQAVFKIFQELLDEE